MHACSTHAVTTLLLIIVHKNIMYAAYYLHILIIDFPPLNQWIPELSLNTCDKEIITSGNWLTDKHLNVAQN